MARPLGNLSSTERVLSLLGGLALTFFALRGGRGRRALASTAGMSLLSRSIAGHCAVKAAVTGESTLKEGVREQWRRVQSGLGITAAAEIDSLEALYVAELQELNSAEAQLSAVLHRLPGTLLNQDLESHLLGYAAEIHSRHEDLERILASWGVDPSAHPDDAMHALVQETQKMQQVCAESVRDAAVLSSVQRLVHFKIAGYGTVATYATSLDRIEDASRLAEYADRDKEVDAELSALAKMLINPAASRRSPSTPRGRTQGTA
jgi:ferritin-like metal-binding protein YciE